MWSGTPDSNRLHPPIGRDAAYTPPGNEVNPGGIF